MALPVSVGAPILAAEYNELRDPVDSIYTSLWFQTAFSADVTADVDSVTELQLFNLYIDLQSLYVHMYGALSADFRPPAIGQKIGADESLDYNQATGAETAVTNSALMGFNDYNTVKIDIENFDLTAHMNYPTGNFTPGSTLTNQRTTAWGNTSSTDDIYHIVEIEFANGADQEAAWLNAGGFITFRADLTGGTVGTSNTKDDDWADLLTAMGVIYVDKNGSSSSNLAGTNYNVGISDLGSGYSLIYEKAGSGAYDDNNYRIYGTRVSAGVYRFRIRFYDGDTGTGDLGGAGTGSPVDEAVGGTLTSRIQPHTPDSGFIWDSTTYTACSVTQVNYSTVYSLSNDPTSVPT